jgi:hypothetical protein
MNTFKYRIYYEYLGPSRDDPFATKPLSPDQVQHYFDRLSDILPSHFSATTKNNSLYVTAVTSDSEQATDTALERCVVSLNRGTSGLSL